VLADLPELAYDALDELRWCAVHPYNGHLLARVEDLKAVCETLPRAQALAVHRAEADPRRDLDLLFLQKLNQCLHEKGLSLNAGHAQVQFKPLFLELSCFSSFTWSSDLECTVPVPPFC
jgi:hypothetical protein